MGSAKPQNFDGLVSMASNVLPFKKLHNLKGKESKGQPRKESRWLPLSEQAQNQPIMEISAKMAKASKKRNANDSLSRKEKTTYPFNDDDAQGIIDELMAAKVISLLEPK